MSNRTQQVVVDGVKSSSANISSGVPQGSVLGPLLFLLYINDMSEVVSSNIRLFADDALIYNLIESDSDCIQLQNDLNQIEKWCEDWLLKLNEGKCCVMHVGRIKNKIIHNYTINNSVLTCVDH